jgi:hypothetical protein
MGWKSTIEISREESIKLIQSKMSDEVFKSMLNRDIEYIMEDMGFGDNPDWEYFGHNFFVVNEVKEYND